MTRENAKAMLPIIKAYAEGKSIESRCIKGDKSLWYDDEDLSFDDDLEYRIKPEPKFRPFKNAEECWQEMQKHQPFGWVKSKEKGYYTFITMLNNRFRLNGYDGWRFDDTINKFTFADGTTFGVKEDK